jgi:hypothetical protein
MFNLLAEQITSWQEVSIYGLRIICFLTTLYIIVSALMNIHRRK